MNLEILKKMYNLNAPLLLCGETGTGKSRLAKIIFDKSEIHKDKFITLHLASIKEELFESELFGHKKGAFTGAIENKNGYLKEVGCGTLFIDEIGELTLDAQKKLLYLLEERKYAPVGSVFTDEFKGRIIMATNRNLQKMLAQGELREDLYYRLMVFQLELAPLRTNKIDLNKKIIKFLTYYKSLHQKPAINFSSELKDFLENYHWRGNVRELKNCIEYLVVMSNSEEVTLAHLPFWINQKTLEYSSEEELVGNYSLDMERFEAKYLKKMLESNEGKINQTARNIKLSKVSLINKAKKYQINTHKMRLTAYEAENVLAA